MEDQAPLPNAPNDEVRDGGLAQALAEERGRVQEFATAYRRQLAEIEARLEEELARVAVALERESQADQREADEAARQAVELDVRLGKLGELESQLAAYPACLRQSLELARQEQQGLAAGLRELDTRVEHRLAELAAAERLLRDGQAELEGRRHEQHAAAEELARVRARWEARSRELDEEFQLLTADQSRLKAQRDRLAAELRERRTELLAEADRRVADHQRASAAREAELSAALDAARQQGEARERERNAALQERDAGARQADEYLQRLAAQEQPFRELSLALDQLRAELLQRHAALLEADQRQAALAAERQALAQELATSAQARDEAQRRQASAEQRVAELQKQLAVPQPQVASQRQAELEQELARARQDIERLERQLTQAGEQLAQRPAATPADNGRLLDLEQRLKMAVDDLRTEKARAAELQKKLSQAGPAPTAGGGMDWESQKRRMLAALEADGPPESADRETDRLRIEEAIRTTEQVLAERDLEINELKELLQQQSAHLGSMAVGAAAVADVLNGDEIVQQERDNLQHLQVEWRNKLRQAEIDISVERAKLARERADLEEKLRVLVEHQAAVGEAAKKPAEKPARGRWLSRLGLKDQPDD